MVKTCFQALPLEAQAQEPMSDQQPGQLWVRQVQQGVSAQYYVGPDRHAGKSHLPPYLLCGFSFLLVPQATSGRHWQVQGSKAQSPQSEHPSFCPTSATAVCVTLCRLINLSVPRPICLHRGGDNSTCLPGALMENPRVPAPAKYS